MNNAATSRLFEEKPEPSLAPVIPIKSVKSEAKKVKPAPAKAGLKKTAPDFTDAVFKPRKHDML